VILSPMKIDPSTNLRDLVAALPSAEPVLRGLGMLSSGAPDGRTLEQACTQAGVRVDEFLSDLDAVDWNTET
jgi:hypothetical protein